MGHPIGRFALLHPFPSLLDGALVVAVFVVAGGTPAAALLLGLGMIGFQVSIGALNDVVDADADAAVKPWKPIPAGLVSPRSAMLVVAAGAGVGVVISWSFGPSVLLLGLAGYGCGVAYDLRLKRAGLGWLPFALAFPLLLLFAWVAASGQLPPRWPVLLPIAALAGPMLHLANGLVDRDDDQTSGVATAAVRLGARRAQGWLGVLVAAVYGCAWASLVIGGTPATGAIVAATTATVMAVVGLLLTAGENRRDREWGWSLQAAGLGLLGVGWLVAASA
jgi:4-hydroxybenzoate polyprenyltransferase